MSNYTLKEAFLNHTRSDCPSVQDVLHYNTRPGLQIPSHTRHHNPRAYADGHEAIKTHMKTLQNEPNLYNYDKLVNALLKRIDSRRVSARIAARTALRIKETPFTLAFSLRRGEHELAYIRETVKYKGLVVRKCDLAYDALLNEWVNPREGSWVAARVITPARIQEANGDYVEPVATHDNTYIYTANLPQNPAPRVYGDNENYVVVRGTKYIRVVDEGGTSSFIHQSLVDDIEVMHRWDATYSLEVINSLMSRSATRSLRGQPDRDPALPSIGVELELSRITSDAGFVRTITDDLRSSLGWRGSVAAVSDGSLDTYGAEFVTGWGDPELVAESIESIISRHNLRTDKHMTSACGVHIHLSRSFFQSREHIAAVQWVFERALFRPVVEFVAHRYNNRYCQAAKTVRRHTTPHSGKYRAVNCDHAPSIEFRMFGCPQNEGDMFHYKDLVLSVVEWARSMPRVWTPRAFGRWLATNGEYARLLRHLEPVFLKFEPRVETVGEAISEAVVSPAVFANDEN